MNQLLASLINSEPGKYQPLQTKALVKIKIPKPLNYDHWSNGLQTDPVLKTIRTWLSKKQKPSMQEVSDIFNSDGQHFLPLIPSMYLSAGGMVVYEDTHHLIPSAKICVPFGLRFDVIDAFHSSYGHRGLELTLHYLSMRTEFPDMRDLTKTMIDNCMVCNAVKKRPSLLVPPFCTTKSYPFHLTLIDIIGPLITTRENPYLLVVEDGQTRWVDAFPMKDKNGEELVGALERFIVKYGVVPRQLHSDSAIVAQLKTDAPLRRLMQFYNCRFTITHDCNPRNSFSEYAARDLRATLRLLMVETKQRWEDVLPLALFTLRTERYGYIHLSPFEAMFGYYHPLPLVVHKSSNPIPPLHERNRRAEICDDFVRKHLAEAMRIHQERASQRAVHYKRGELVWVFTPSRSLLTTRSLFWTGPWKVEAREKYPLFRLVFEHAEGGRTHIRVSQRRMAPFHTPVSSLVSWAPSIDHDLELHDDFRAESMPPPPMEQKYEVFLTPRDYVVDVSIPSPFLIAPNVPELSTPPIKHTMMKGASVPPGTFHCLAPPTVQLHRSDQQSQNQNNPPTSSALDLSAPSSLHPETITFHAVNETNSAAVASTSGGVVYQVEDPSSSNTTTETIIMVNEIKEENEINPSDFLTQDGPTIIAPNSPSRSEAVPFSSTSSDPMWGTLQTPLSPVSTKPPAANPFS